MDEMFDMLRRCSSHITILFALLLFSVGVTAIAKAGEADITKVEITATGKRVYRIDVTVKHADSGWDHYANRWEVRSLNGNVLGVRELGHPHVSEQPFTRTLSGVEIPEGIDKVEVRARDSVHGYGGAPALVKVPE
jgi:hypothetical protein